jgi:hypothetical protein
MNGVYLYCLVRSRRAPKLDGAPRGLPGMSRLRAVGGEGSHWLVVADAPLARYGATEIERGLRDLSWVGRCALAHEAVVEHFARASTSAPMKMFTLFDDERRALAHVARRRRKIDRSLDLVDGCAEYGLRLALDERRALVSMTKRARPAKSGAQFLEAKRDSHRALGQVHDAARAAADAAFDAIARRARRAIARPPAQSQLARRVILDAVFLVPHRGTDRFLDEIDRVGRTLPPAIVPTSLNGPWPPYSFLQ